MSSVQQDPRILYSINNIRAFHIQNGEESELTSSGPQTLSLLMVPTSSPAQNDDNYGAAEEEDFYLHLHLPPELDMALPATTQIYHQPPASYLIPRWDLGPDAGAFIRLQFPGIGSGPGKASQEEVDTFETILAQCTAFLERAAPPQNHATYNPADYAPGEGYISSDDKKGANPGQIVLIDEEDGSVVGELGEGYQVEEKPGVQPGSKSMSPSPLKKSVVYYFLTPVKRPRRDPAPARRRKQQNQHHQRLRRIPAHVPAPSVQKLNHRKNLGNGIAAHRHGFQLPRQRAQQRRRQLHATHKTEP